MKGMIFGTVASTLVTLSVAYAAQSNHTFLNQGTVITMDSGSHLFSDEGKYRVNLFNTAGTSTLMIGFQKGNPTTGKRPGFLATSTIECVDSPDETQNTLCIFEDDTEVSGSADMFKRGFRAVELRADKSGIDLIKLDGSIVPLNIVKVAPYTP